jgi:hypothetical protein
MNVARAINIVRSGAEDYQDANPQPQLCEARAFLEQFLGSVRRYRNALRGDARNQRDKDTTGTAAGSVSWHSGRLRRDPLSEHLALDYRENKTPIDTLRQQLAIVRRPVAT